MKCAKCGQEVPSNMNYCDMCGSPVIRNNSLPKNQYKHCRECGADIEPGSAYCDKCGASTEEKKQKEGKRIVPVVFTIIVALLLGSVIFIFANNRGKGKVKKNEDTITYTVICKDTDEKTLSTYTNEGSIGDQITVTAEQIKGYSICNNQQTITLTNDAAENVIVFLYHPDIEKQNIEEPYSEVEYTVICMDSLADKEIQKKSYMGYVGTEVTLNAPYIEGYFPYDEEQTFTLTEDESQNEICFFYEKIYIEPDDSESVAGLSQNTVIIREPFYGIWIAASKDSMEAKAFADEANRFNANVFVTTDWDNLNGEKWYVVSAGIYYDEESAVFALDNIKQYYPDAYIKWTGSYIGD